LPGLELNTFLSALLGWLGGLLSAQLLDRNRKVRHDALIREALKAEASAFRYRMAMLSWRLAHNRGSIDPDLLLWLRAHVGSYAGPERNEDEQKKLVASLDAMLADPPSLAEAVRREAIILKSKAPALKRYPTPCLDAAVANLGSFAPKERYAVLEAHTLARTFDAVVDDAAQFFRMQLSAATQGVSDSASENLDSAYDHALSLARTSTDRWAAIEAF